MRCPLCTGKIGADWIKVGTIYVHRYCAYVYVKSSAGEVGGDRFKREQQDTNEDPFE